MLKLSASSLLVHSSRKLFCSGFRLERAAEHSLSGFRVYSGRSPFRARSRAGLVCFVAAADRSGRLGGHFGLRRAAYRSGGWVAVPRAPLSPLTVPLSTARSLKKDGGPEGDLENSPRTRQPAPAKRSVRTVKATSNTRKVQQRVVTEVDESSSSAGKSRRVSSKPKAQVPGGQDSSSKDFGGKTILVGSGITKPSISKPHGRPPKEPNSLKSIKNSRVSGIATASGAVVDSNSPPDLVEAEVTPSSAMNPNKNSSRQKQATDEAKRKQQSEWKPKKKDFPAEAMLRRDLNMCSKDGDVLRALEIYERSAADGIVKWNQYNFNILLYLCSSAALGTLTARKSGTDKASAERLNLTSTEQNSDGTSIVEPTNGVKQQGGDSNGETTGGTVATAIPIVLSPEVVELASQRGFEIFEDMKKQGVPPNEATLTAVARLAIKKEDGDLAFQMVKEMAAQNIAPKLRSYSPALVVFCKNKAVEKAFQVDAHMVAAGVEPEEPELGALLQLCVELGLQKEVYSLLHRIRARVRGLSPNTISSVEEWFSGQAGASAGEEGEQPDISAIKQAMVIRGGGWHGLGWLGKGKWKVEWTTIDNEGLCRSCKNKLVTIDLDTKETENFAQSVAKLAFARETKSNDFQKFQEWLELNGPFDAVIDGANVGLYNQNFHQGGFNFFQLNAVAQAALDRGLVKNPPLIVLHHARTKFGAANSSLGQQLLKKWSSSNTLYTTPNGSNDDWYWMYAAVRNQCLLITNDEMRDHLFQLLGSDFFPKWKERHQVRFSATTRGLEFHLPPPYSLVIQECENGSWHIPNAGGNDVNAPHEWMCVTRPVLSLDIDALPVSEVAAELAKNDAEPTPEALVVEDKEQTCASPEHDSRESKRLRAHSPSSTLKKTRVVDKQITSGPVLFDT